MKKWVNSDKLSAEGGLGAKSVDMVDKYLCNDATVLLSAAVFFARNMVKWTPGFSGKMSTGKVI